MTDSSKFHSVAAEGESGAYPVALARCMQHEPGSHSSCGEISCLEGVPSGNATANAQALHTTYSVHDFFPVNSPSMPELASSSINTAGSDSDSCRPPDHIFSSRCSSACSSPNHAEDHSFVWSVASPSTSTRTHVPLALSSADHPPSPHDTHPPESTPPSFLTLGGQHGLPAPRVRQLPSPLTGRFQDSVLSISEHVIRNSYPTLTRVPALSTTHYGDDHLPYSGHRDDRSQFSASESTLPTEIDSHRVSVPSSPGDILDTGFLSDPEHPSRSETGDRVHQVRRAPPSHVRAHTRQGTEGTRHIQIRPHTLSRSASISPILRPYCVSVVSNPTPSSPEVDGESLEDCDDLPPLLSPSDSDATAESDHRAPFPSPYTSRNTNTHSDTQAVPDDGRSRSRFLNPGTPIQTDLPSIQSLLDFFQTDTGHSRRFAVVPLGPDTNTNISISPAGDQADFQVTSSSEDDDDDIAGDIQRATELLAGLERVNSSLVRRYERVRGYGSDICTVCRDALLPPEPEDLKDTSSGDPENEQRHDHEPVVPWNTRSASTTPPHHDATPPPSGSEPEPETGIHAFPCCHLFHTNCLIPWLSLKTTCPTCRLDIDPHSLTLRVRGWAPAASRWPHIEQSQERERQYVNVDAQGRRIPWHRPPAASLEEWVDRRENETPEEREKRLTAFLRPSHCPRRHSEPPAPPDCCLESAAHHDPSPSHAGLRRRTLSEPPGPTMYIDIDPPCGNWNSHTPSESLGSIAVCESPEELESAAGYFAPRVRVYSVGGAPRWSVPDQETRYTTTADRMRLGLPPHGSPIHVVRH